ncbi:hypothetical protein D3C87_1880610 [compost metagenome]
MDACTKFTLQLRHGVAGVQTFFGTFRNRGEVHGAVEDDVKSHSEKSPDLVGGFQAASSFP